MGRKRMGRIYLLADAGQENLEANRLVYQEKDGAIIVASCKGHYDD